MNIFRLIYLGFILKIETNEKFARVEIRDELLILLLNIYCVSFYPMLRSKVVFCKL